MLNKIINFSLHNKLFVLLGVVLLVLGGYYSMRHLDIDVFPDLTAPTVVVMTDAENMATEEVERLVTFPIETAVNGATDVRRVRSSSRPGAPKASRPSWPPRPASWAKSSLSGSKPTLPT